jgi:hypothetical protein
MNILNQIPNQKELPDDNSSQTPRDIMNPTIISKSLMHCTACPDPPWNTAGQVRGKNCNRLPMNPSIHPKEGCSTIPHKRVNRGLEESFSIGMYFYVELSSWPLHLCFSEPEPSHINIPTKDFQVVNIQAAKLKWSTHPCPSNSTMASLDIFSALPEETPANHVNGFDNPFRA